MSKICDFDCFNCKYSDCINDELHEADKDYYSAYRKEWYKKRTEKAAAAGLCNACFKRPATGGFKTCTECREKRRIAQARNLTKRKLAES